MHDQTPPGVCKPCGRVNPAVSMLLLLQTHPARLTSWSMESCCGSRLSNTCSSTTCRRWVPVQRGRAGGVSSCRLPAADVLRTVVSSMRGALRRWALVAAAPPPLPRLHFPHGQEHREWHAHSVGQGCDACSCMATLPPAGEHPGGGVRPGRGAPTTQAINAA